MTRQVKVESWPQAKQQRTPEARADLNAVLRSDLPASGPFRLPIRVRDVQGAQQSGLPDRAAAEPGAARPEGQRPAPVALRETLQEFVVFYMGRVAKPQDSPVNCDRAMAGILH